MRKHLYQFLLPYPRTPNLPYHANLAADDILATQEEAARIITCPEVIVYEKIDGSNLGMCLWDGHPVVRNKTHIFHKGVIARTAARGQYASVFNWCHDHIAAFHRLAKLTGLDNPVVYGEWLVMAHGVRYDNLPDWFVAFDILDAPLGMFLPAQEAKEMLAQAGFLTPPLVHRGAVPSYDFLAGLCEAPSPWVQTGDQRREGIVVHVGEARFKMVRQDFVRGRYFDKEMVRNSLAGKRKLGH